MGETAAMRTLLSGPFPWLIGAFGLVLAIAACWIAGSAVVIDETQSVKSAVVTNDGGTEQKLYQLWSGYFYAVPDMDGVIEVRCGNVRKQAGYVTTHMHTKIRVVGTTPCEKLVEIL
jgi:hypothetical protein